MRIGSPSKEDLIEGHQRVAEFLAGDGEAVKSAVRADNKGRILDHISHSLGGVFHDKYARGKNEAGKHLPFEDCRGRLLEHLGATLLLKARRGGDRRRADETMRAVARDDWRIYLSSVGTSGTSASPRYRAKDDGCRPRSFLYSCADPLQNNTGQLRLTGPGRCHLLADFPKRRLNPPRSVLSPFSPHLSGSVQRPATPISHRPSGVTLASPYWGPMKGFLRDFVMKEMGKALEGVATQKKNTQFHSQNY